MRIHRLLLAMMTLVAVLVHADEDPNSRTVIGPRNIDLHDGASALLKGDAEGGVPLTMRGLKFAQGQREEKVGHANLCAGFMMLGQAETALIHCNWVIARDPKHWRTYNNRALVYLRLQRFDESDADIKKGQALNPGSEKLKEVKGLFLDAVEPVTEEITIDDRRRAPAEETRR
jgi:hypothetical protein